MSKQIKLLLILIALTLGIPLIKIAMIYLGIVELLSTNFIVSLLVNLFNLFSLDVPKRILIILAEIFWPFSLTVCVMHICKYYKKKLFTHPSALAISFWVILHGSSILIS